MGWPWRYAPLYIGILLVTTVASIYVAQVEGFQDKTLYTIPFYIERKNNSIPDTISDVPLVIYQSWHSNKVPVKMHETIHDLIRMNPEFDYYLYSDEASLKFIKDNFDADVEGAFNTLKPGAYKSDLWRYCILYKLGGVYLDIKYYSVVPLINIIRNNPMIYVRDLVGSCPKGNGIYNAFMVSPPNNNIFRQSIATIVNNCKFKLYKSNSLDITGPCMLGSVIDDHKIVKSIDFYLYWPETRIGEIHYKGNPILKAYPEYAQEQRAFQTAPHYGILWASREVFI